MIKKKNNIKIILIFFLIFTAIMGASLTVVVIPVVGNIYLFRILTIIVCFYIIFISNRNIQDGLTTKLFIFWLGYGVLTLLWTPDRLTVLKNLIGYGLGMMFAISLLQLIVQRKMLYILTISAAVLFQILCFQGIFESFTGIYFFETARGIDVYITPNNLHYPVSVFSNPNNFVLYLLAFLPFYFSTLNNILSERISLKRFLKIVYLILVIVIIELGLCRMGWLVLAVMALTRVFLLKNKAPFLLILLALILAFCLNELLGIYPIIEKLAQEDRLEIWSNILRNASHYHFMGMGPGTANMELPNIGYIGYLTNPHFWFLEILTEFGIFVFVAVLIGLGIIFVKNYRRFNHSDDKAERQNSIACLTFLVAFVPLSIMASSVAIAPQFWFILGLMLVFSKNYEKTKKHV